MSASRAFVARNTGPRCAHRVSTNGSCHARARPSLAPPLQSASRVHPLAPTPARDRQLSGTEAPSSATNDAHVSHLVIAVGKRLDELFSHPSRISPAVAMALAIVAAAAGCAPAMAATVPSIDIPGLVGDDPLREGFVSGFILIFFSELGDKTFFIALLLALQAKKEAVFAGTFGALAVMTVISVALGVALHEVDELLPNTGIPWDDLLSVALLVWFGVRTLSGAESFTTKAAEEKEEAGEVLEEGSFKDKESAALVLSTFALVFAAEWGDKSFIATIALAAASSPVGVVAGAVAGHGVATALAVAGGNAMGKYVSEKAVAYVGGSLFLVFAAATLLDIVRGVH